MIVLESIDPKIDGIERNTKTKLKLEEISIFSPNDDQIIKIRMNLPIDFKEELIKTLKDNVEVSTLTIVNMPSIDLEIAYHKLRIDLLG